jgi:5-methylcytosine-specific restriction protein A
VVAFLFSKEVKHMPYKPKAPCKHTNCAKLTYDSYCQEHMPQNIRENSSKRGYNYKWRKLRKLFLQKNPLCHKCKQDGKYVEATVVDHIEPHRGDDKLMWDENNWQSLCKPCHDSKTGKYDSLKEYKY